MQETKATRLQELATVVPVPIFFVLDRGDHFRDDNLLTEKQYIVRSSTDFEDQQYSSQAGQSKTFGPLIKREVSKHVDILFENPRVTQVIVQEFVSSNEGNGVAFCFEREQLYVEYSLRGQGVTSGTVKPYVALLPSKIAHYQMLTTFLQKLYDHYGLCDVEFIGITNPQFVQVRPITQTFEIDKDRTRLQMELQESKESTWIENDICRVMAEHGEKAAHYRQVYIRAMQNVSKKYFKKTISPIEQPFVQIGSQFFMAGEMEKQLTPHFFDLLRLAIAFPSLRRYMRSTPLEEYTLAAAMEYSIILSFMYALFPSQKTFALRQNFREYIDAKLEERIFPYIIETPLQLKEKIMCDPQKRIWTSFEQKDTNGIIIVDGDFESGPFFDLKSSDQNIPQGVIVRTEQLYPEIGRVITDLKGIVCENGALTSHIAILAREHDIPLKIQAKLS